MSSSVGSLKLTSAPSKTSGLPWPFLYPQVPPSRDILSVRGPVQPRGVAAPDASCRPRYIRRSRTLPSHCPRGLEVPRSCRRRTSRLRRNPGMRGTGSRDGGAEVEARAEHDGVLTVVVPCVGLAAVDALHNPSAARGAVNGPGIGRMKSAFLVGLREGEKGQRVVVGRLMPGIAAVFGIINVAFPPLRPAMLAAMILGRRG